jgi:hypothetical protein
MSDKNEQITELGLSRLLDQFQGSPNLLALATSYLAQVQAFEDAAHPMLPERDIDQMTGDRLDGLGRITNQFRSGLSDDDYRQQLKAELAVLRSLGTAEEILTIAQLLIEMATADYEMYELYPKALYLRPVDHVLTQDPATIGAKLRRAVSATTDMLFVYSLADDADTFRLSSQGAAVETSNALGLATVPSGFTWRYDAAAIVLAGLLSTEFRLNHADPTLATELYIHDNDIAASDKSVWLAALTGSILSVQKTTATYLVYVTGVTDNTGTFTLDIDVRDEWATFDDDDLMTLIDYYDGGMLSGAA